MANVQDAEVEPNAHTFVLKFHRLLSEAEWRTVIDAVRTVPHVVEIEAQAVEETPEELARRRGEATEKGDE